LQAELQQTLSTQKPLRQALVALHGVPFASLRVQTPPEQYSPPAQSPSTVQPFAQTLPAQVEDGQLTVCAPGQLAELPVQLAASVATPPVQLAVRHCVDEGLNKSDGQASLEPSHFSSRSQSPGAARHTNVFGRLTSLGHVVELPVHVSATSHGPPAERQMAPELPAGCWHELLVPLQVSALHALPSSVHVVPAPFFRSAGQALLDPSQVSSRSQSPAAMRHTKTTDCFASVGQAVEVPVHVSAMSHGPAAIRQTAPLLPAGCWQLLLLPLHASVVQALPSSVQAVLFGFFASVGQASETPSHFSSMSHSPPAERHTKVLARLASAHVVLVPLQKSATSQADPLAARQSVPELPAGCWQELFEPLHVSDVQGLPSSVQAVPFGTLVSLGQVVAPLQVSAASHSPTAGRHTVVAGTAEHVPTDPVFAQESQMPALQAVLQQTPSTQKPLVH
jgi:hypothetical protein